MLIFNENFVEIFERFLTDNVLNVVSLMEKTQAPNKW